MPGKRTKIEVFTGIKCGGKCNSVRFAGTEQVGPPQHSLGSRLYVIMCRLGRRLIQESLDISDVYGPIEQDKVVSHRKLWRRADVLEFNCNLLARRHLKCRQ